ncbi:MAG TPA: hypothetical protein VK034_25015, partial [Enhygromyxa sp.]|nr:hypothetical protein [Enhygromyxa sp.]
AKYASLHQNGINDVWRSPGCPYSFDEGGMMNTPKLSPRAYDMWHLALWMAEAKHSFAGTTNIAVRHGPYRYAPPVTAPDQSRALFPVIRRLNRAIGTSGGLCDLFGYALGVDGYTAGEGGIGGSLANPWDLIIVCRVKLALTLRADEHRSYNGGVSLLRRLERLLLRIFNRERPLAARGTFEGRQVRARILFSPRFIVRTYPSGTSDHRTAYLRAIDKTMVVEEDYSTKVNDLIDESGIHADVVVDEDTDDHGLTNTASTPRQATLDSDDLEDDAVEIFGRLIGMSDPDEDDPNDYAALVDALAPEFVRSSLEFLS